MATQPHTPDRGEVALQKKEAIAVTPETWVV